MTKSQNDEVTLSKDVPRPEDYEPHDELNLFYQHTGEGRDIFESNYERRKDERNLLARYIKEIEPYHD